MRHDAGCRDIRDTCSFPRGRHDCRCGVDVCSSFVVGCLVVNSRRSRECDVAQSQVEVVDVDLVRALQWNEGAGIAGARNRHHSGLCRTVYMWSCRSVFLTAGFCALYWYSSLSAAQHNGKFCVVQICTPKLSIRALPHKVAHTDLQQCLRRLCSPTPPWRPAELFQESRCQWTRQPLQSGTPFHHEPDQHR